MSLKKLAIIGLGPRGLAAAEAALEVVPGLRICIFEPGPYPGVGPNFRPDEAPECLLNLPVRELDLGAPRFADWLGGTSEAYPPRAEVGRYLTERWQRLQSQVEHVPATAVSAHYDRGWIVDDRGPFDNLLLTQGQPPVTQDAQAARWSAHAAAQKLTFIDAYPTTSIRSVDWRGRVAALRGLALSALDVIALLTLGQGGTMDGDSYRASGREPDLIVPFSLDGMPPMPKPANADIDALFDPSPTERRAVISAVTRALTLSPDAAVQCLTDALAPIIARVTNTDPQPWLAAERDAPGAQERDDPVSALETGLSMAEGQRAPSVGYAVGQIWRKLQQDVRGPFAACDGSCATRSALVAFENGLKRYSYGPPVRSARLLRALIHKALVRLTVAEDPAISLERGGWRLNDQILADAMIDCVLPGPSPDDITDPLVRGLIRAGHLKVDCGLKPVTDGLSVLGRTTEGQRWATNSLVDCFGDVTAEWARKSLGGSKGV
ncbi:FAD/NAD(P)-binding protein [Tritonibacter scottomollicae]|uniref:FAD/NAD(P)-binding protein n=1 Tax=Tritonibacter scottomollicae TaxID=483013 RepID=UPI002942BB10|nr:FAD/NAD(P)-binding protein [Tritonibacter scottomollicae]